MKKISMMIVGAIMFCIPTMSAKSNKTVESAISNAKNAPSGTVYGVVEKTADYYVVNTPIGKYTIKHENGWFSFMGVKAKIVSHKGSIYVVDSNLGKYRIDTKRCTMTKL